MSAFTPNLNLDHAPTIVNFMRDRSDIRIIKGPVGSGKTTGLCFAVLQIALMQERSPRDGVRYTRPVILRNTYAELKTTTIQTWKENFPEDAFGRIGGTPPISQHIKIPGELDCEIFFLAMDQPKDVRKLLSLNVSHIYWNEMREFQEDIVLAGWDRVGRFPNRSADKHGVECTYPCMIGDTNPPDEDHWMYEWEFGGPEDQNGERILKSLKFFNQPGAVIDVTKEAHKHENVIQAAGRQYIVNPKAENVPNLPTKYYEKKLPFNNKERIQVYYESKYGVVGHGKPVCPEYNDESMSVENLPVLKDRPLIICADVGGGTLSPSALIFQRHPRGTLLFHAEIVCFDMGNEEFCNQINQTLAELFPGREIEEGFGDPAGITKDEIFETVVFHFMRSKGIPIKGAPTNDIKVRIEALRAPMTRLIDGKPGILIHKRCKVFRAGLAGKWVYRRLQVAGAERYADKPDKGKYSHVCDAGGYGCLGTGEYQAIRGRSNIKNRKPVKAQTNWDPMK